MHIYICIYISLLVYYYIVMKASVYSWEYTCGYLLTFNYSYYLYLSVSNKPGCYLHIVFNIEYWTVHNEFRTCYFYHSVTLGFNPIVFLQQQNTSHPVQDEAYPHSVSKSNQAYRYRPPTPPSPQLNDGVKKSIIGVILQQ